jgi:hypothetical protein
MWSNQLRATFILCLAVLPGRAQDLVPRAYLITPVASNAITISSSFFNGAVSTDPTLPIKDFKGSFDVSVLSYSRSFNFFGRSANFVGSLPYAVGNFKALVFNAENRVYRSGLTDARVRVAVNLRGGPAMGLDDFVKWREKLVIGTSFTMVTPIGQYDPARLVNPGFNRWAFKPELGGSRRWGHWALDLYGGVWFFTANNAFFPGMNVRTQAPTGSGETHLSYTWKPRCWVSLDGNFWAGGRTTVNEKEDSDYQRNSRVGATVSIPVNRRQSFKFSYSQGAYISIGGDYKSVSAAWLYSWVSDSR